MYFLRHRRRLRPRPGLSSGRPARNRRTGHSREPRSSRGFRAAGRSDLGVGFVVLLRFFRDVLPVPLEAMQCACSDLLLWVGRNVTAKVATYCYFNITGGVLFFLHTDINLYYLTRSESEPHSTYVLCRTALNQMGQTCGSFPPNRWLRRLCPVPTATSSGGLRNYWLQFQQPLCACDGPLVTLNQWVSVFYSASTTSVNEYVSFLSTYPNSIQKTV